VSDKLKDAETKLAFANDAIKNKDSEIAILNAKVKSVEDKQGDEDKGFLAMKYAKKGGLDAMTPLGKKVKDLCNKEAAIGRKLLEDKLDTQLTDSGLNIIPAADDPTKTPIPASSRDSRLSKEVD
jgi:hypothetical protein